MDGKGVLAEIKKDPDLRRIPVSILTSSQADRDVTQSYELGANCYVVKPIDFKSFLRIVRVIENFWFATVKLSAGAPHPFVSD
jgi:two-component system response regulator